MLCLVSDSQEMKPTNLLIPGQKKHQIHSWGEGIKGSKRCLLGGQFDFTTVWAHNKNPLPFPKPARS